MLASNSAAAEDLFKLLLLIAAGGGLLLLARWSSRLGGSDSTGLSPDLATPDVADLLPDPATRTSPPSAEEVAASLPYDPALGNLRIRKFFFTKAEAFPGPEDPEVFADELNIELYDPDSGHAWWQSYFIATPQGLSMLLREKSWRYLHAPEIIVFPRYNLEEIRRAVVTRIMANHDYFKGEKQEEESL
jgi:hypothetical protein